MTSFVVIFRSTTAGRVKGSTGGWQRRRCWRVNSLARRKPSNLEFNKIGQTCKLSKINAFLCFTLIRIIYKFELIYRIVTSRTFHRQTVLGRRYTLLKSNYRRETENDLQLKNYFKIVFILFRNYLLDPNPKSLPNRSAKDI